MTFYQTYGLLAIVSELLFIQPFLPYIVIVALAFITYCYVFKAGFVSDDLSGIAEFDGKLQGAEYGMISRWLRYHICGGNYPSKKKFPDGKPIPLGKTPWRHHLLILSVFTLACLLAYQALIGIVGAKVALLAVCLFIVHPVGVQAVAWASALGYPLSLLWIVSNIVLLQWFYANQSLNNAIITTLAFCLFSFLGIHAQFVPMMQWVILAFLGYYPFAILGLIISLVMSFDIIKQTIGLRAGEFKKQQMGGSTYLKPKKVIVALKTIAYYFALTLFPKRMGLYHKWGFHYNEELEHPDWRFWAGVGVVALAGFSFFYFPIVAIKFSILWFFAFIVIFLNWITIQQFVTERYLFIPTLGTCIIISFLLQDYVYIYTLILGGYLVRTWMHLPTYDNELRFYQSNNWNFPESEVALGNLGVTYMRIGAQGTALDTWHQATRINPEYDVPWYNIFSSMKAGATQQIQNGNYVAGLQGLGQSLPYLEKTLACKVCHFPDQWKKEAEELRDMLKNPTTYLQNELKRLKELKVTLDKRKTENKPGEDMNGVEISLRDSTNQMTNLEAFMKQNNLPTT